MSKILLARHTIHEIHPQDYVADTVFNGLYLSGHEVTDDARCWYLYKTEFEQWGGKYKLDAGYRQGWSIAHPLNGGGFSYAAIQDEDMSINRDRNVITQRIKDHYYDKVIVGFQNWKPSYMDTIFENYERKDILALDSRDEPDVDWEFANRTTYFKREMIGEPNEFFRPISFAMPNVKCRLDLAEKIKPLGTVIPGHMNTYVFSREKDYYNDYASSLFAVTCKKSGWDCMRHYEILANRCVPYFADIDHCPINIMKTLDKELLSYIKKQVDVTGFEYYMPGQPGWDQYKEWEEKLHIHFINNCTTLQLGNYMLC